MAYEKPGQENIIQTAKPERGRPDNRTHKECSRCKEELERKHFYIRKRNGFPDRLSSSCRQCESVYRKTRNYNISFDEALLYTICKCSICGVEGKKIVVDHDHETGKVRGPLCFNCNTGIGMFEEDIDRINKAIKYLETHGNTKRDKG